MWTCPLCNRQFIHNNQVHSCNDKALADFLNGKSEQTLALFWNFIDAYNEIGNISVHPTKSMIGIAADKRIAWITRLGKNFVDITFPFTQPYNDNLCFHKIAQVPGTQQFNHHFRLMQTEDINEEVKRFMALAYKEGKQ